MKYVKTEIAYTSLRDGRDLTKKLMKDRDETRLRMLKGNSDSQRKVMLKKYKVIRNQVNSAQRKDSIDFNNNRIEEEKDENEV